MQNENSSVEQHYRTQVILWAALLMSQFMFLLVIYFAKPEVYNFDFSKPLLGENAPIILIFALLAVACLVASFIISKKLLNDAIEKQNAELTQTAMIVGSALCEAITMFGLVLAFAFAYQYFFISFSVGILGIIYHFPKRQNLHSATYKQAQKF